MRPFYRDPWSCACLGFAAGLLFMGALSLWSKSSALEAYRQANIQLARERDAAMSYCDDIVHSVWPQARRAATH